MITRVKIRGIYSTALTRLLLDWGYAVVEPSMKICERFGLENNNEPHDILIQDRDELQGVELCGESERLCQFLTFLQERLLDAVLIDLRTVDDPEGQVKATVELPGASKKVLDELRFAVTPTIQRHHRLRIIDPRLLEQVEVDLLTHPARKAGLEEKLFQETIFLPLEKNGIVRLEHMRPSGKAMRPREGVLVNADDQRVVFRRSFFKGRYDGLDLPINEGDYGLTEIREGSWTVKHSYFTKEGRLIGEYYNINTPVELYPYGARYVDLEVDVIRRAGEQPFLIDREKLSLVARQGCIGAALETKAMEVAEELMLSLQG